jgi:5'-nucleotidase
MLGVFGRAPQIVISGVNAGANVGRFHLLHSGTLGGALTGGNYGLRAMAISLHVSDDTVGDMHWATAADIAVRLLPQLIAQPRRTVWNVNVPNIGIDQIAGIAEASIGGGGSQTLVAVGEMPGPVTLALVKRTGPPGPPEDPTSERILLASGFVAVTSVVPPSLVPVGPLTLETETH